MQRAGMEIAIHVDAAQGAFDRIDLPILVAIQLLKMIVGQVEPLRTGDAARRTGTRIIALGIFEHPIGNQIGPGPYYRFDGRLPRSLQGPTARSPLRRRLRTG